jgi:hypothetical protein
MKQEVATAIVLASMSDREVLEAYQVAAKTKDPLVRQLGRELLVRFHRANPAYFTREMIDRYDSGEPLIPREVSRSEDVQEEKDGSR